MTFFVINVLCRYANFTRVHWYVLEKTGQHANDEGTQTLDINQNFSSSYHMHMTRVHWYANSTIVHWFVIDTWHKHVDPKYYFIRECVKRKKLLVLMNTWEVTNIKQTSSWKLCQGWSSKKWEVSLAARKSINIPGENVWWTIHQITKVQQLNKRLLIAGNMEYGWPGLQQRISLVC